MTKVKVESWIMRFEANCTKIEKENILGCPMHKYAVSRGKMAQVSFDDKGVCNLFIGGRNMQDLVNIRQLCLDCTYRRTR